MSKKSTGMWPTPTMMDGLRVGKETNLEHWRESHARHAARGVNKHKPLLIALLEAGEKMLPTPKGRDWKGETQRGPDAPGDGIQNTLAAGSGETKAHRGKSRGLRLQPAFVEWMMGYPLGFTDIEYTVSRRSGTASSRRSPTKSFD